MFSDREIKTALLTVRNEESFSNNGRTFKATGTTSFQRHNIGAIRPPARHSKPTSKYLSKKQLRTK